MCQRVSDFYRINTGFGSYIETECFAFLTKQQAAIIRSLAKLGIGADLKPSSYTRPGETIGPGKVPSIHAVGFALDVVHENPAYLYQSFLQLYPNWPGGLGLNIDPRCAHLHLDARSRRTVWLETSCPTIGAGGSVIVPQLVDSVEPSAHRIFLKALADAGTRFPDNGERSTYARVSRAIMDHWKTIIGQMAESTGYVVDSLARIASPHLPGWPAVLLTLGAVYVASRGVQKYVEKHT